MRSFDVEIEPCAGRTLAALSLFVHAAAAAAPWLTHVALPAAIALSLVAAGGLAATLARIPGRHCTLQAIAFDARNCRARLAGTRSFLPARLTARSRASPWLVSLELQIGRRRLGWLLPRGSLPPDQFRRLRARIRLSC
jgi:hypothetical protein